MRFTKFITLFLSILICFNSVAFTKVSAVDEKLLVKVGFILNDGFHSIAQNGELDGYNYNYLMEIKQHSNLDFEFVIFDDVDVNSSMIKAITMLESGEIDLLGSMNYNDDLAQMFEFCSQYYGIARHTLSALGSNDRVNSDNYFHVEDFKVALINNSTIANQAFAKMTQLYNLDPQITYVDTYDECMDLVISGKVDAIMYKDISYSNGLLVTLDSIDPTPFYFASTKGNSLLTNAIDKAIIEIQKAEPTITQRLKTQFFHNEHGEVLLLTPAEELAVSKFDYLTVGLVKGVEPYQFYDDNSVLPNGISTEILNQLSLITGVKFKYKWVDDYDQLLNEINLQNIDICATLPHDYNTAQKLNVTLSRPYISSSAVWLQHEDLDITTQVYSYFVSDNIPLYQKDEIIPITNVEQNIQNLSRFGDTQLFCDPYIAQFTLQKLGYNNIKSQSITNVSSSISMGVAKHLDTEILGLLNHSILHLDQSTVDEIIFHNLTDNRGLSFMAYVRSNSIQFIFALILFFTFIILSLIFYVRKITKMKKTLAIEHDKMLLLAQQDILTGLYNSGFFHNLAKEKCDSIQNGALILFDIDLFKQVNDTYGHQMGDKIIIQVANAIKKSFNFIQQLDNSIVDDNKSYVGRLGGDEFVVLFEGLHSKQELENLCQDILDSLSSSNLEAKTSLSIGGYIFNESTSYETLYQLADKNLYKVKESGRNGYQF